MMTSKQAILMATLSLALTGVPMLAHHSFAAEYDSTKPVKISGVVTKFDMTNPHAWIHVDVKGPDGTVVNWAFETASPNTLFRRGFRKDFLKPGAMVTIEGFQAKDASHTGNAQTLVLPDGKQVVLGTEVNPG
jgi:hypothetical protein